MAESRFKHRPVTIPNRAPVLFSTDLHGYPAARLTYILVGGKDTLFHGKTRKENASCLTLTSVP